GRGRRSVSRPGRQRSVSSRLSGAAARSREVRGHEDCILGMLPGRSCPMAFDASVHAKATELIKLAIEMTTAAGSGHPTSAASLAHLVTVLMYQHMRYDPKNPAHPA